MSQRELFRLGSLVSLHVRSTLKPNKEDFTNAARELGISPALARKAWHVFTWN